LLKQQIHQATREVKAALDELAKSELIVVETRHQQLSRYSINASKIRVVKSLLVSIDKSEEGLSA
jgi:hypothetical protein